MYCSSLKCTGNGTQDPQRYEDQTVGSPVLITFDTYLVLIAHNKEKTNLPLQPKANNEAKQLLFVIPFSAEATYMSSAFKKVLSTDI